MAKGKEGFMLEGWKFSIYIIVPIFASIYYSEPKRQKDAADYWKFIQYPSNPNINMKQKIEDLASQQKQRNIYREQLQLLNQHANNIENVNNNNNDDVNSSTSTLSSSNTTDNKPRSRFGWLRFW